MENTKTELYESPEMMVEEIKVRQIICASDSQLEEYTGNEW